MTLTQSGTAPTFTNTGDITIASGRTFTVSAGTFNYDGGSISACGTFNLQSGSFVGTGTIAPNFTNSGQVNPGGSPGVINMTSNYTKNSSGQLNIEIGGLTAATDFDQLNIAGAATLDGTLNISLINSFTPNLGDSFEIMTFASRSGTFSTVNGLDLGGGLAFQLNFNPTNLTLVVVQ